MKVLAVTGFAVAFIGFVIAAMGFNRELGINLFYVGFYLAVASFVTDSLRTKFPRKMGFGLKIGAVGFAIASLGFLVSIFGASERVATRISNFGFLVFFIGVAVGVFSSARQTEADTRDSSDSEDE